MLKEKVYAALKEAISGMDIYSGAEAPVPGRKKTGQ